VVSDVKIQFSDLEGWIKEDHSAAFDVFSRTSSLINGFDKNTEQSVLKKEISPKVFFEKTFNPILINSPKSVLFTGYYEPEINGSLVKDDEFKFPIYRKPKELNTKKKWFSRRDIEEKNILKGKNLEIVFLRTALEVFLLQVQGSGRIILRDRSILRVGYDCKNGHDYVSIGKVLVGRGVFSTNTISHQALKNWITTNPNEGNELLYENPSYVFFKVVPDLSPLSGPIGTAKTPLESFRSIAIDPLHIPLGSPTWIEKKGHPLLKKIMIAQDTGSAIIGPARADIYCGAGEKAEEIAGNINELGSMIVFKIRD